MLSAHLCFTKNFFYQFIAFITIFSDIKKMTDPPNFFDALPVRRLKKVENHCNSEQSFFTLRRQKTFLRNTIDITRMNGLTLLNIYRSHTPCPDDVINRLSEKTGV